MLTKNSLVKVTNRSYGIVGYTIPDLSIRRDFNSNETKELTMEELRKLVYIPGGRKLMEKYLVIHDEEAVAELMGDVEPEYFYTETEIKELLTHGTIDQLEDCLNFASAGVITLLQKIAVELEVNSVEMREMIFKKTGYNVDNAIRIKHSEEEPEEETTATTRKAAPVSVKAPTGRKAAAPKYKVTSIGNK